MNLHVEVAYGKQKHQLPLWQTPTQITYTITAGETSLKGTKARRALRAYYEWVQHSVNGSYESLEDAEHAKELRDEHAAEIEPFLNSKRVRVYVL